MKRGGFKHGLSATYSVARVAVGIQPFSTQDRKHFTTFEGGPQSNYEQIYNKPKLILQQTKQQQEIILTSIMNQHALLNNQYSIHV